MDVKTVCLGMLTDGPASGYDMKKCFESTFGHFFPAGYGSIYPALATLARNGHVEFEEIPQEGKPDRKVYSNTPSGRDELDKALANPNPTHRVRSEFLAMMCFAHLMTDEQINAVIDNKIQELSALMQIINELPTEEDGPLPKGTRFVAGFGHFVAASLTSYINDNRDMLTTDKKIMAAVGS